MGGFSGSFVGGCFWIGCCWVAGGYFWVGLVVWFNFGWGFFGQVLWVEWIFG